MFRSRRLKAGGASPKARYLLLCAYTSEGIVYASEPESQEWVDQPQQFGAATSQVELISMLLGAGRAEQRAFDVLVPWREVYPMYAPSDVSRDFDEDVFTPKALNLPPIFDLRFEVVNEGSLADSDFSISCTKFGDERGNALMGVEISDTPIITYKGSNYLLPKETFELLNLIREIRQRPKGQRALNDNRRYLGRLQHKIKMTRCTLANYLLNTIVVTADKLKIRLRKNDIMDQSVVEVTPYFDGISAELGQAWLEAFDRQKEVQPIYHLGHNEISLHVCFNEDAQRVLQEIHAMPGRVAAGARADAFIHNPLAALGPAAQEVLDPEQIEQAKADAGIGYSSIEANVIYDDEQSKILGVSLLVTEHLATGERETLVRFQSTEEARAFIMDFQKCESRGNVLFRAARPKKIAIDINPQSSGVIAQLAEKLQHSSVELIGLDEVMHFERMHSRIYGFGEEIEYRSPYISKGDDRNWFPVEANRARITRDVVDINGKSERISLSETQLDELRDNIVQSQQIGKDVCMIPELETPVPLAQAQSLLEQGNDILSGSYDFSKKKSDLTVDQPDVSYLQKSRQRVLIKMNDNIVDYIEQRATILAGILPAEIPQGLVSGICLIDHQIDGLAWLQNLWRHSPRSCGGALLADDMGLGKTLQILSLIAWILQTTPDAEPFLVVAPVSLLHNWASEAKKFFGINAPRILSLYGRSEIEKLRVPKGALSRELSEIESIKLLREDWIGEAQIVMTNYETLRDFEFALAAKAWSGIICDEAQKIKNPNAMVTRAAKKQNARFRIACTGTPVENSLTDLWCLFDFIQPGLLGSLSEFGSTYKRPEDAKSEEDLANIENLRQLIKPQIMRRLKDEVAKDLPRKIYSESGRSLPVSKLQRALYADAMHFLKTEKDAGYAHVHLKLLQDLRTVCYAPRPQVGYNLETASMEELEEWSPRVRWLLNELRCIQKRKEKALVFCEMKGLQLIIKRAVRECFGIEASIINGDTSIAEASSRSRQRLIDQFQALPAFGVLVLSPIAVGFGVNIQAANHVIHYTRHWNPAKEDQATDRAYRIGQTRDVYVYRPLVVATDFTTFDVTLDRLLEQKRALSRDILNGGASLTPGDFSILDGPEGMKSDLRKPISRSIVQRMDASEFEEFISVLWSRKEGGTAQRVGGSGDKGVDVVVSSLGRACLIQAKTSAKRDIELGWAAICQVVGGKEHYAQRFPVDTAIELVAVSNQKFSRDALEQARLNNVFVFDIDGIERLLREHQVMMHEIVNVK